MGFSDDERLKYTRQGRSGKRHKLVASLRGGIWRAWFEGRGHVVGFGETKRDAVSALKGLL